MSDSKSTVAVCLPEPPLPYPFGSHKYQSTNRFMPLLNSKYVDDKDDTSDSEAPSPGSVSPNHTVQSSLEPERQGPKQPRKKTKNKKKTQKKTETTQKGKQIGKRDVFDVGCSMCWGINHSHHNCPYNEYVPPGEHVGPKYEVTCCCFTVVECITVDGEKKWYCPWCESTDVVGIANFKLEPPRNKTNRTTVRSLRGI